MKAEQQAQQQIAALQQQKTQLDDHISKLETDIQQLKTMLQNERGKIQSWRITLDTTNNEKTDLERQLHLTLHQQNLL